MPFSRSLAAFAFLFNLPLNEIFLSLIALKAYTDLLTIWRLISLQHAIWQASGLILDALRFISAIEHDTLLRSCPRYHAVRCIAKWGDVSCLVELGVYYKHSPRIFAQAVYWDLCLGSPDPDITELFKPLYWSAWDFFCLALWYIAPVEKFFILHVFWRIIYFWMHCY